MTKYSMDFRLEIVKLVSSGVSTATSAAVLYDGMCKGDVQKWLAVYEAHGQTQTDVGTSRKAVDESLSVAIRNALGSLKDMDGA